MTRLLRGGQTIPSPSVGPEGVTIVAIEDGGITPPLRSSFRLPLFIALAIPSDVSDVTVIWHVRLPLEHASRPSMSSWLGV